MSQPSLSVMMSNYNHARSITEALEAIVAQSYRPMEIIIIDDGSTDGSVSVLERFTRKEATLIRVLRNERNMGVLHNIKYLLELTSGEYVYSAAADDRILPGFFERSMNLLVRHRAAGLCSTLSGIMDASGEYQGVVRTPIVRKTEGYLGPDEALATLRRHGSWFMGNTTVFRRSALIEAGGFIAELGPYCDGFISLVLAVKHGACFIPEPLAIWRRMDETYSRWVSMDVDATFNIGQTAERLMRSTYRDLFPADYVEEWRREWLFGVSGSFMALSGQRQLAGLERLMQPRDAVDRIFLSALQVWSTGARILTRLYLFLRLRRTHLWRRVDRTLIYLLRPRLRGPRR